MQRHKRFAWTWATASLFAAAGVLGACAAEDGSQESVPGFKVPDDATSLSFYAWGASGGEGVRFPVGMGANRDGFSLELKDVALTAEPKQYTIGLSRVRYGKVVGGFGWVAGGRTSPLVLFIDDIQWC